MQLYHYLSTVQQSKEHALDLRSPSSYYQISLLSVTAKLLERVVSTLKCPFLLLSFSFESTATRISPPLLWRSSSGQGHQWRPCWLPQLLTQPKVCHLLPLWGLSLNFLFVKYSGYHKWKERDFAHVLPKFDNAAYPASILYNAILWDN